MKSSKGSEVNETEEDEDRLDFVATTKLIGDANNPCIQVDISDSQNEEHEENLRHLQTEEIMDEPEARTTDETGAEVLHDNSVAAAEEPIDHDTEQDMQLTDTDGTSVATETTREPPVPRKTSTE
ncbi:hypothetical protein DPMN_154413 [Dreissena polymorpha]|uniref:Uncharacterized protein n=1 Tax=Dreissena polymorpha TaxID=45954 RepID=A0A9D4FPW5_DREPO|nr:hypothetical protein DPMN_154413 [Dreissena polymorpha]